MKITRIEKVEVEIDVSDLNESELMALAKKVLVSEILELGEIQYD